MGCAGGYVGSDILCVHLDIYDETIDKATAFLIKITSRYHGSQGSGSHSPDKATGMSRRYNRRDKRSNYAFPLELRKCRADPLTLTIHLPQR